jgi:DNA-binding SARP family transcriptional activator
MEFRLLGPVEVRQAGTALMIGGPRRRAVLAALAVRANEVASVPYLTEAVWDTPPAAPESNLRTYITGLRRRLGEAAGDPRIATRSGGYVLMARTGEVDACSFEELVKRGDAATRAGDVEEAAGRFAAALALWRGRPLEGLDVGASLRAEAVRLEDLRVGAAERYARSARTLGRHEEVIHALRGLVVEYPLREELWAELMAALDAAGRRADVLDAYREARTLLAGELGLEPGARLRWLHRRALTAAPSRGSLYLDAP